MSRAQVLGILLLQAEERVMKDMTDDAQDHYIIG